MFRFLSLAVLALSVTTPSVLAAEVPPELKEQFVEASKKLNDVHGSTTTTVHPRDDNDEERFLQDRDDDERYPRCSICPEGQAMSRPDAVLPIELDSGEDVTCGLVRFIGAYGGVSPEACPKLRNDFADDCGCVAVSRSGADPRCSVCDEGETIGRPNFVAAETSSGTELTCQDLDDLGYARELSPSECSSVRSSEVQGSSMCRCTPTSSFGGGGNSNSGGSSPTRAPQTQPTRPTPAPTAVTEPTSPTPGSQEVAAAAALPLLTMRTMTEIP